MPEISRFLGIVITMYYDEHCPPHFHARYEKYRASVSIKDCMIIEGSLPPRILGLVIEWAMLHKKELTREWENVEKQKPLFKIKPLE